METPTAILCASLLSSVHCLIFSLTLLLLLLLLLPLQPKGKETQLTNAEKECALFQQAVQSENIQALQYTALTDYCPCLTDTINVDINDGGHVEEVSVCELSNPPAVYEAYCLQEFESVREAVERQQMAFVIALEEHAALLDELLSNNNVDNLLPETITQLIHESQVRLTTALAVSMASAPCLEGCHQFVKLVCCAPKNQSTP